MRETKGASPIKVAVAGLILVMMFVGAMVGLHFMSDSVSEEVDESTTYFEENEEEAENSSFEKEDLNEKSGLLEAHYRSSNVAFAL